MLIYCHYRINQTPEQNNYNNQTPAKAPSTGQQQSHSGDEATSWAKFPEQKSDTEEAAQGGSKQQKSDGDDEQGESKTMDTVIVFVNIGHFTTIPHNEFSM